MELEKGGARRPPMFHVELRINLLEAAGPQSLSKGKGLGRPASLWLRRAPGVMPQSMPASARARAFAPSCFLRIGIGRTVQHDPRRDARP